MYPVKMSITCPCLLAVVFLSSVSRAEIPCDLSLELYAVNYEGDTLPEDDPVAPWAAGPVGDAAARIENGVLIIEAGPGSYITYGREEPDVRSATAYSMEASVWFSNLVVPPTQSTASMGISDGEKEAALYFQDGLNKRILVDLATGERVEFPIDWEQPHTYRIEVERDQNMLVFADDSVVFDIPYEDLFDTLNDNAGLFLSGFHGAESTSYWDYVRYRICAPPPDNFPPVAVAGASFAVTEGERARLDGTLSHDPEGAPLSYAWTQTAGPEVQLDDPSSPTPGFVAPPLAEGDVVKFSLVVNDGVMDSALGGVSVWIRKQEEALPTPEQQFAKMSVYVQQLDAPWFVRRSIGRQIDRAGRSEDPQERGRALYRAGRHLNTMKIAGLVREDATELESLMDFEMFGAGITREEGYLGRVKITSVDPIVSALDPGVRDLHYRVSMEVRVPWGLQRGSKRAAVKARVGVVDIKTGEVIRTDTFINVLDRLPPGRSVAIEPLDYFWDGFADDGTLVAIDDSFFIDVIGDVVLYDLDLPPWQGVIGQLDTAGTIVLSPIYQVKKYEYQATSGEEAYLPAFDLCGSDAACKQISFVDAVSYLPAGDDDFSFRVVPMTCVGEPMCQWVRDPQSNHYHVWGERGNTSSEVPFRISTWQLPPYVEYVRRELFIQGKDGFAGWAYTLPEGHFGFAVLEMTDYWTRGATDFTAIARAVAVGRTIVAGALSDFGNDNSVAAYRITVLHWPQEYTNVKGELMFRLYASNNDSFLYTLDSSYIDRERLLYGTTAYVTDTDRYKYTDFDNVFMMSMIKDTPADWDWYHNMGVVADLMQGAEALAGGDLGKAVGHIRSALASIFKGSPSDRRDNDFFVETGEHDVTEGKDIFLYVGDGNAQCLGEASVWTLRLPSPTIRR